ncbi:uncharacterized protein LOC121780759 [Salvia splendens]|uniref:uncharacterized protein LOC121780759 n=1 Tax=Salvia splendens TaxID=180675 RepID=UPI001C268DA5|nr:uncharacterized protein LOC121780759 [Salvia splendens]
MYRPFLQQLIHYWSRIRRCSSLVLSVLDRLYSDEPRCIKVQKTSRKMSLLEPVAFGGQAISWGAGKLETNRNGLPTSPSSSEVQSRVLQAAAKLESQPPEEVHISEA